VSRLLWPLLFLAIAAAAYHTRIRHEMVDFDVYRTAAIRALDAESLYRASDGHYQFKYLPAFALLMAPFALVDREAAKVIWFALSAGLLTAFVRWSVRALPERERAESLLIWLTILFMGKFYAHELILGQTNILLGVLLVGALLAIQVDLPGVGGALIGLAVFVKPYALVLLPWLAFSYGSAAMAGVAVFTAGLVLPAIVYGWRGNIQLLVEWFRTVTETTGGLTLATDNVSFTAMWTKWLGVTPAATALATMTTGAALGLVATVWVRRRLVTNPDYLEFALLLLLIPLFSPQGWDYVLLLGTPAVVCLLDRWATMTRAWRIATAVSLVVMGLTTFDIMGRALYMRFMMLSLISVAAIAAAVSLANLRWRSVS
jgi:hypothetical protein